MGGPELFSEIKKEETQVSEDEEEAFIQVHMA